MGPAELTSAIVTMGACVLLGVVLGRLLLLYGRRRTQMQLREALARDQAILADLPADSLGALQLRKRINATAVLYSTRLVLKKQRRAARIGAFAHGVAMLGIFTVTAAAPRDLLDLMVGCTCTGFFAAFLVSDLRIILHRNVLTLPASATPETSGDVTSADPDPDPDEDEG